jgi:hypothetical protein
MKFNRHLLQSAKEEWSDWLEAPDHPSFDAEALRRWVKNKPPLYAFAELAKAIEVMQDDIDLLHMQLAAMTVDYQETLRKSIKRI